MRSGVLTSVHTFASDPTRGVFILAILVLFIGGGLALYAWRAPALKQGGLFAPISREGALVFNNLFLTAACATVFVGTLYPLALEALTGEKISVGAPFFNLTFGPLFVPLLLVVPFGPLMAWKRGDLLGVAQRLIGAAGIAVVVIAATFAMTGGGPVLAPFGIGLAAFVMAGAVTDLVERTGLLRVPLATALARARGLPRSAFGTAIAHFGLGVTLLGIVCASTWGAERIVAMKPDATVSLRSYDLTFDGMVTRQGPNYRELIAKFTVRQGGDVDRRHGAVEAHLPVAAELDHRSRADDARREPALSLARRSQRGRLDRGAALSQAAGAADLARRGGDGVRRRAVAVRPAAAGRRAEAGQAAQAGDAAGGVSRDASRGPWLHCLVVAAALIGASPALAVQPDEILPDPALEARARTLSRELRCMVCQNQSIDDSDAPLARDLRILVRERLKAGDSDAQVLDFLTARYGEFVLLKPRFGWDTALLWLAPAGGAADRRVRACRRAAAAPARARDGDRRPMTEPQLTRGRARTPCGIARRWRTVHRPARRK